MPSPRTAAPPNEPGRRSKADGRGVDDDHLVAGPVEASARTEPTRPHPTMTVFTGSPPGSARARPRLHRERSSGRTGSSGPWRSRPRTSCDRPGRRRAGRPRARGPRRRGRRPTSRAWSRTGSSLTPADSAVPSARSSTCWISSERPATSTSSGIDQSISTTWTPISSALLALASSATRRMSRSPFGCPESATTARRNAGAAAALRHGRHSTTAPRRQSAAEAGIPGASGRGPAPAASAPSLRRSASSRTASGPRADRGR